MAAPPKGTTALSFAHPAVQSWFVENLGAPTPAQEQAWPAIAQGESTLLLAPTGSGKTLAAFLVEIDWLLFKRPEPASGTRVVYISPLKALGVDVEKNLRRPLAGITELAQQRGDSLHRVTVGVRSGDTPTSERRQLQKKPPDILITTPESLNLMLTSSARETLRQVQTVIVDEIHALSSSKRGSHLFFSLERLERLRTLSTPLQRIGLSATQRPLSEIARLLGGYREQESGQLLERSITIVDCGKQRALELRVEVPVEDMSQVTTATREMPDSKLPSIWPSIHAQLLKLIRAHKSTIIFANSRRLAERLAGAINELAEEELALAHHGSIAKESRLAIESRLKAGQLPAIVATSSLELGIDMGAVDLVIQVEAPSSVASGLQRVGRAGHQVGGLSRGTFFPKFRGDLLACAATVELMRQAQVEALHYPRNPLDVLAQQIVATLSMDSLYADELYQLARHSSPFRELPRELFDSVLDMLSGRYPSTHFAELRPRINWDRETGELEARRGARLLAVANSGSIVDRGLYGVFLSATEPAVRVGELDEEMVFECTPGDVFLLGASSWRIDEITQNKVLVSPAPGEPGRMPFWRGDRPARPSQLGMAIGALTRQLLDSPTDQSLDALIERGLSKNAATNLVSYVQEQEERGRAPTDRRIVVEMFEDEVGDHKVVILSPFGGRVHAPWATVIAATLETHLGATPDSIWVDDGMVFRLPRGDISPKLEWFLPRADYAKQVVEQQLARTALFSAHFRECAARSLLLPRRRPGQRTPLWIQRRKSSDLLAVASHYPDFPIVLEAYRECLHDVFDMPEFLNLMNNIATGQVSVEAVNTSTPSPFAASVMFSYVGNFLYNLDAPLAERKAQLLRLDQAQLRALLGEQELRDLLDPDVIQAVERERQGLSSQFKARDADQIHDLLWRLGDLTEQQLEARCETEHLAAHLEMLSHKGRIVQLELQGELRFIVAEDAARYRDALKLELPVTSKLPKALLNSVSAPLEDLVLRFASNRGPFTQKQLQERYGLEPEQALNALQALESAGQLKRGAYLPDGRGEEWCHNEVLQRIKLVSLKRLREQIKPVSQACYARSLLEWQQVEQIELAPNVTDNSHAWESLKPVLQGEEGLLEVIEQLQGYPLSFVHLHTDVFPKRLRDYHPSDLDRLCANGDLVWRVMSGRGSDCRVGLFLAEDYPALAPPTEPVTSDLAKRLRDLLGSSGGVFFSQLLEQLGGFPSELFDTLWEMVWAGEVSNDTLAPLQSLVLGKGSDASRSSSRRHRAQRSRSHRALGGSRNQRKPGSEGRWKLLPNEPVPSAERAMQLLRRYGVVSREAVAQEALQGGFSAVYPVLKALEESGQLRRGYFIEGLGAAQFALPTAAEALRQLQHTNTSRACVLAATDPASAYGSSLPWPSHETARSQRAANCYVVLVNGELLAYLGKGQQHLWFWLDPTTPATDERLQLLLAALDNWFEQHSASVWLVETVNSEPATESPWLPHLLKVGFTKHARGLLLRRALR